MFAKHTLKYTYEGSEDFSPIDVTFDIPGDASLSQMLYNFQSYLKATGFVFDGELEIVNHTDEECSEQHECCNNNDTTIGEYSKDFWKNVSWDQNK